MGDDIAKTPSPNATCDDPSWSPVARGVNSTSEIPGVELTTPLRAPFIILHRNDLANEALGAPDDMIPITSDSAPSMLMKNDPAAQLFQLAAQCDALATSAGHEQRRNELLALANTYRAEAARITSKPLFHWDMAHR